MLSYFNLMDYSLLFVAAYNPNYVEMYPEKFTKGEKKGEWVLVPEEQHKRHIKESSFKSDRKKKHIKNEFLQKMSGLERRDYYDQIRVS